MFLWGCSFIDVNTVFKATAGFQLMIGQMIGLWTLEMKKRPVLLYLFFTLRRHLVGFVRVY